LSGPPSAPSRSRSRSRRPAARLGTGFGAIAIAIAAAAIIWLPFVEFKTSRIATGRPLSLFASLATGWGPAVAASLVLGAAIASFAAGLRTRLIAALLGFAVVALAVGRAAEALTPAGNRIARISPGAGCWVLLLAFGLMATNALSRFRLRPARRVLALLATAAVVYAAFAAGLFDQLSVMREYTVNAGGFAREARRHLLLAAGSIAPAVLVGVPIGVLCHLIPPVRAAVLQTLNLIQTIPSIALFGILMVPLGALATAHPWLGELGVRGIGAAPALIALFLYALLPVATSTVVGLGRVSAAAIDAARGMGLTHGQVLRAIELPLALPSILTGIRIVLVQNIGLATIAALIGGGGFGTFVFQGIGQTAIDLVLLGAIPIVVLGFSCAVLLDALVDLLQGTPP
jgi:osmoprotectant transport system permease protein